MNRPDGGRDLATRIYDALSEKKAESLAFLDCAGKTTIADRMLAACGTSPPHLEAMAEAVEQLADDAGLRVHREGTGETGWILLAAGDVVVHLFSYEKRSRYRIEELYSIFR